MTGILRVITQSRPSLFDCIPPRAMTSRWKTFFALLFLQVLLAAHSHPFGRKGGPTPRDLFDTLSDDILDPEEQEIGIGDGGVLQPGPSKITFGGATETQMLSSSTTPTISITTSTTSTRNNLPTSFPVSTSISTKATMLASPSPSPSVSPTVSPPGGYSQAASTPPAEGREWKVIGLVIICITFVGTLILSVVFFDSWWNFLRAMLCGRKKREGSEDLVPDWEKRSWEFQLANEDGHRYPTMGSMENVEAAQLKRDESATSMLKPGDRRGGIHARSPPQLSLPQLSYHGSRIPDRLGRGQGSNGAWPPRNAA